MKKQRSLESREQNRYKHVRRGQRRDKRQIHRTYLRARLGELFTALCEPLPPGWAILYPELAEVMGHADGLATEWAVFETTAPWFTQLSRQRGGQFSRKREPPVSDFTLDLIILTYSVLENFARSEAQCVERPA